VIDRPGASERMVDAAQESVIDERHKSDIRGVLPWTGKSAYLARAERRTRQTGNQQHGV